MEEKRDMYALAVTNSPPHPSGWSLTGALVRGGHQLRDPESPQAPNPPPPTPPTHYSTTHQDS